MIYGGLDLLISRTNIRSFASAVACLSKIGKEVFVHSNAEGMTLSALSDTKSCYVTIRFDTDFFMQCNPLMGGTCSGGVDERELKRLTQRRKKRIKEMKERERGEEKVEGEAEGEGGREGGEGRKGEGEYEREGECEGEGERERERARARARERKGERSGAGGSG